MEVNNSQITKYMLSLYPEFKSYKDLEKHLIGNCRLSGDYFINEFREECREDITDNDIDCDSYINTLNILKEHDLRFASYFASFISERYSDIYSSACKCGIVGDIKEFMSDIVCKIYSQLYNIVIRVLLFELEIAKDQGLLLGNTSEERFEYFSEILLTDEKYVSQLHDEYKVMFSLITKTVDKTSEYITEILRNTSEYMSEIQNEFFLGEYFGDLLYINLSSGDTHKDCRSVAILVFENGKVVYKPHSLVCDMSFQRLIGYMNNMVDEKFRLRKVKIVCCDGYGFTEFVEHSQVKDIEGLKLFYRKSGILLGLLYACNMSDCHFENIIASGTDPVLIDTETLFHSILPDVMYVDDRNCAYMKIRKFLNSSVCGIGLLPTYINVKGKNNEKKHIKIGGIAGSAAQESPFFGYDLSNIGSDDMKMVPCDISIDSSNNSPVINGEEADPRDYSEEIAAGFETAYRSIMENKEQFIDTVVSLFDNTYSRIVVKATMVYASLLNIATHPDYMRTEIFTRFLLSRVGLIRTHINVTEYEINSLLSRVVPIYYANFSEKYIVNGNGNIYENALDHTPKEDFIEKVNSFSEKDLSIQLHFISSSYFVPTDEHCWISFYDSSDKKADKQKLIDTAVKIGEYLIEQRSISGVNNKGVKERYFFGCTLERVDHEDYTNCITNPELYNGTYGIALYLYYLGKVSGKKHFVDAAYEALEPVKCIMRTGEINFLQNTGAFTGISGCFYVLCKIAENEDDDELRMFISEHLHIISDMARNEPHRIDLISGTSGGFAVLLSIVRNTKDKKLKETALREAEKCFGYIYDSVYKNNVLYFELCGFSHGISGALPYIYEYYLISHSENALKLFNDLLSYERNEFCSRRDGKIYGWYSSMKKDHIMISWCHGISGIMLEKYMLKELGYYDDMIDEELETAVKLVKSDCIGTALSYCHGDMGNISILKMYAEYIRDEQLILRCENVFADLFDKYLSGIENNENILCQKYSGLMIGLAGAGYACLNEADSSLPSFLKLD